MSDLIFRGDAVIQRQVTTITPTVTDNELFDLLINGKTTDGYTSDGTATAQEIVEGLQAALDGNAKDIPEVDEITWDEDNATVIATGRTDGQPFTVAEGPGSGDFASITTGTAAKSPNHWIAENFTGGALPGADNVYIAGTSTSIKWGLDQNAVTLGLLEIYRDFTGEIGLPERNTDADEYYEYRDTHLKISATALRIGMGEGQGSGRIKINTGSNACEATIFSTGTPTDPDEAAVHLVGTHASNTLQVFGGTVDLSILPGYTGQWPVIVASGGTVRAGTGVTLGVVEASGNATVETRSAVTTGRTRDNGRWNHKISGNITTADLHGGPLTISGSAAITITTLNGYSGSSLDLSQCDAAVTVTNMNIYATPQNPFTIIDPMNRLTMTNAAACQGGAASLRVVSGSGRNVRVT